ncbi:MAG: 23S rRNA (pseudouridine(1915)-N(3))-methyltransferase RlmH [Magnetovibrionaceae bacterium]
MKTTLIAVGRLKRGPEADLLDAYAKRLKPRLTVIEVEDKRKLDVAERRRREAELIGHHLSDNAYLIALDERGKALPSETFADEIAKIRDQGRAELVFVIGGADGLDQSLRKRADKILAFGPATWPHMLVRVMLAEQLYRAQSILAGHPYHRGG